MRYHRQRDVDSIDLFHFAKDMGDPEYINPLNREVFAHVGSRPDLLSRMAQSSDRELSPYAVLPAADVVGWTLKAALRGRISVLRPFLAAGRRGRELDAIRRERSALRAQV